jgi:beta-galactosidase GanA
MNTTRSFPRLFAGALFLAAAGCLPPRAQSPPPANAPSSSRPSVDEAFFPYGAMHMSTISHWQHYLPPLDQWADYIERDLVNMKKVHFNTLAAHVDWYDIEPGPERFEFARLDRLIDLAEKHGLKVLLWPWPELQPEWVVRVYPDSEMIASDHYRPEMACCDHPAVRRHVARFIDRVVSRYRNRPSVLAWDVGAEAGNWVSFINNPIDQKRTSRLYCYCEHTVRRYREWLRAKYGSLEKLNEVWAAYYRDWSEVRPIRTGIFERAQVFWVDWREFMLWNIAEFQGLKADAARRADPAHPITAHMGGWGGSYVYGSSDEYQIGRHFDVLSLSLFPYWIESGHGWYEASLAGLCLDGVRSAGNSKPMWIEELQGGPSINGLVYRSTFPRSQDIRLWVWQSVAHGATGIFYWNWRPETTGIEAGGFGLVNGDGSLTDRAMAAGEVCEQLQRHARLIRAARPARAQVGIVHNPRTSIHAYGDGDEGMYIASVRGIYRALWRANLPVDILAPEQLLNGDLSRYRILYLPFAYTISPAEGARLKSYVASGGTLFAEMWCGFKDDRTFVYETVPGAGLAEVFHCREVQVNPRNRAALKVAMKHEAVPLVPVGAEIPVYKWQEQLATLGGAEALAKFDDGSPAIITGTFGKGKTLYVATPVARSYDQSLDANIFKLLAGAASWAGVEPPVAVQREPQDAPAEARVLESGDGRRLVIALNHSETKAAVRLTLPTRHPMSISDLITGEQVASVRQEDKTRLVLDMPSGGVRVLLVEAR